MTMTLAATAYGSLHLDAGVLTILGIAAAALVVVATLLYIMCNNPVGLVPHIIGMIILFVLIATWWTADTVDWNDLGPVPVIGGLLLAAVYIVGPFVIDKKITKT